MNLLITGSSGFLGSIISQYFENTIQDFVWKISRTKTELERSIHVDLSKEIPNLKNLSFDLVIHCAGKAHIIPKTLEEKQSFYTVNVEGTKNLLLGIETLTIKPKAFVFISSVAVYGISSGNLLPETTILAAKDPYGQSKIEAEKLVWEWGLKNNITIAILRLPLVVGENPPGNLKNMLNAIKKGYYFRIGDGKAKRSMVLGKDVAKVIPIVATKGGIYNLTDGHHPTFGELENILLLSYHIKRRIKSIPMPIAKVLAYIGDSIEKITKKPFIFNSNKLEKITSSLTFSDTLARENLGWNPVSILNHYKPKY
ncbi:NAD-dependent epimerase/dehydratase family protein [Emticicia sp. SJ17W-69]|uniref:NAD-dependent epimerase/dehydratase family protein n=1 Tax=Emticicia sp. SJ17W-69 TaxID=3421657 RepID=UPI003EBA85F6